MLSGGGGESARPPRRASSEGGAVREDGRESARASRGRRRRRGRRRGGGGRRQPVGREVRDAARRLGIARLHDEQAHVVRDVLDGKDVLVVLPTGFGKSACYQIPSMVMPQPVVLVSPLLALLRDQHEKLLARDVACVRLDGTVRGRARAAALARIAEGGPLLVMTTPETLATKDASDLLRKVGIALAAVDEAHCVSEWGHDFRPAYLRLGEHLRDLGRPAVLALTATATAAVRDDVVRALAMREPSVVATSPHRSNLAFETLPCRGDERLRALVRFVRRLHRPGIVYCSTTREVDEVYAVLARFGIPTHRYHGRMAAGERNKQQEQFMKPRRRVVMVATSAFGLGIDKPDIRYVLHNRSPASLEQYVQEAGRAGRDGRRAHCVLLHDDADRNVHEALLARSRIRPEQLYGLGRALAAWVGERRTPTLEGLAVSAELGERTTLALLAVLEQVELVSLRDDRIDVHVAAADVEPAARQLARRFENLRTQDSRRLDAVAEYAGSEACRAVFLREYFGEEPGAPCGLCDVCRGRSGRPDTFFEPLAAPTRPRGRRGRGRGRRRRSGSRQD